MGDEVRLLDVLTLTALAAAAFWGYCQMVINKCVTRRLELLEERDN